MDWPTIIASVAASGVIATGASLIVSKRESNDRKEALQLEREKFQHQRDQERRIVEADYKVAKRLALTEALDMTRQLRGLASSVKTIDRRAPHYQQERNEMGFRVSGVRAEVVQMRDRLYSYGFESAGMHLAHAHAELRDFASMWNSNLYLGSGKDGEYTLTAVGDDDYKTHESEFYLRIEACSRDIRTELEDGS